MLARTLYEGIIKDRLYDCQSYMEIGSYDGDGISMLSRLFPDKKYYSIDPFVEDGHTWQAEKGHPIDHIRAAFMRNTEGLGIVHFDMTSEEFVKRELYKTVSPDVLFIDGNHSFECVTLDLHLAELFKKRLFVIMDDTVIIEGVVRALDEFKKRHPEITFNSLKEYGAVYFYIG